MKKILILLITLISVSVHAQQWNIVNESISVTPSVPEESTFVLQSSSVDDIHHGIGHWVNSLQTNAGTYTPNNQYEVNITAAYFEVALYTRIGDMVTVSGLVAIEATASNTITSVEINLPISSDIYAATIFGVGFSDDEFGLGLRIKSDSANDLAVFSFISGGTQNRNFSYTFTYQVQ